MKEYQRKFLKKLIIRTIIFLTISLVFLLSLFFSEKIERKINKKYFEFSSSIDNCKFKIHFVDVGQGDCTIIELPDDKLMMIDTGPNTSNDKVQKYLKVLGVNKGGIIDYLILTHTDSDHVGNAEMILDNYDIKNIYIPKVYSNYEVKNNLDLFDYNVNTSSMWEDICFAISQEDSHLFYNEMNLVIENPQKDYSLVFNSPFDEKLSDSNNYSPIIVLKYKTFKFMFVGDIDASVEQEFLNYYSSVLNNFDMDLLKVAHHGSKNSTTTEFLSAVKPEKAIISCGKDNSYAHPNNETINRLTNCGAEILRTDTTSSIVVAANTNNLYYQTSYDFISSFNFCWWHFVVSAIVLFACLVFSIKIKG